jgi:hypothetical protein
MSKSVFNLAKLPLNTPEALWVDNTQDWMGAILDEMNEGFDQSEREEVKSFMRFKGEIHKVNDPRMEEVVIIKGELSARICAICGRSGDLIGDEIDIQINAALLEQQIIQKRQLEEEVNVWVQNEEYDLFTYEQNKVDIVPMLKEYVYMNKNPYPMKG